MQVILERGGGDPKALIDRDLKLLQEQTVNFSGPILRCWENSQCLVVGKQLSRWKGFAQAANTMASRGWPIVVRSSGGTIVPHYSGVLNLSYIYAINTNIDGGKKSFTDAYHRLCTPLIAALTALGVNADTGSVKGAYCDGDFNIRINGKKLAGTAQQWKQAVANPNRHLILVHSSINTSKSAIGANAVNKFLSLCGQQNNHMLINAAAHTDLQKELFQTDDNADLRVDQNALIEQLVSAFTNQTIVCN